MSKGLEALKELKCAYVNLPLDDGLSVCTAITKEYKKELDIIEKELKALEIIKKLVNSFDDLPCGKHVQEQVIKILDSYLKEHLKQEEYDLLKEVLL